MDYWDCEVDNWCDECVRTSGQMMQLLPAHWVILFLIFSSDLVQGPYLRRHQMQRKR